MRSALWGRQALFREWKLSQAEGPGRNGPGGEEPGNKLSASSRQRPGGRISASGRTGQCVAHWEKGPPWRQQGAGGRNWVRGTNCSAQGRVGTESNCVVKARMFSLIIDRVGSSARELEDARPGSHAVWKRSVDHYLYSLSLCPLCIRKNKSWRNVQLFLLSVNALTFQVPEINGTWCPLSFSGMM